MSSSDPNSAIFMTDTPAEITTKIKKFAFSGGRATKEEQQKLGANLDIDVSYQYLEVYLHDDKKLQQIKDDYSSGKMLTNEIKEHLINILVPFVTEHQTKRAQVTDEIVKKFMEIRPLSFRFAKK